MVGLEVCCNVSLTMLEVVDTVIADDSDTELDVFMAIDVVLAKLEIVSKVHTTIPWVQLTVAVCRAGGPVLRLSAKRKLPAAIWK